MDTKQDAGPLAPVSMGERLAGVLVVAIAAVMLAVALDMALGGKLSARIGKVPCGCEDEADDAGA
jgi:hypothetical protein